MEVDPRAYYDSGFTEATDSSDLTVSSNLDSLTSSVYNKMRRQQQRHSGGGYDGSSSEESPGRSRRASQQRATLQGKRNRRVKEDDGVRMMTQQR